MRASMVMILASLAVGGCGGGSGTTTQPPPPVFTSLSVTPDTGTIFGAPGTTIQMTATPLDQNGRAMSGLGTPTWASSDETIATVDGSGLVTSVALGGPVSITATLSSGGVTQSGHGSLVVADIPLSASVTATTGQAFQPASVTIKAGGQVTWVFQSLAHTVTFNSPNATGTPEGIGTAGSPVANTSISRTFTTAGTYPYHCLIHQGMTGTVIVK